MKKPNLIIENLKAILEECTASEGAVSYVNSEDAETLKAAIEALEKQEQKPAKAKFNKRYNTFVYFCPVCGEVTGHYDYCSDCGQALDYDNAEPYTEEEA